MTPRAVGCCVIAGYTAACLAAVWLNGELARRRCARARAAQRVRDAEAEAAEVAMLHRWYAAESAEEPS